MRFEQNGERIASLQHIEGRHKLGLARYYTVYFKAFNLWACYLLHCQFLKSIRLHHVQCVWIMNG